MQKILLFLFGLLCLTGCTDTDSPTIQEDQNTIPEAYLLSIGESSKLHAFNIFGEIHNDMLSHTADKFDAPVNGQQTQDQKLSYLAEFQADHAKTLVAECDKRILASKFDDNKSFYITEGLLPIFTKSGHGPIVNQDGQQDNIWDTIDILTKKGCIDIDEAEILRRIADLIEANGNGSMSFQEYGNELSKVIDEWETTYSNIDFTELICFDISKKPYLSSNVTRLPKGTVSGIILNIAAYSYN